MYLYCVIIKVTLRYVTLRYWGSRVVVVVVVVKTKKNEEKRMKRKE